MSNFSFEPLKLKLATNNIIIPMQNGVADLTNAETSAKIMLAGKELFPNFDERIGSRNLLKNTKGIVISSDYWMATYELGNLRPTDGEQVTVMFKGKLAPGKTRFQLYNSNDTTVLIYIYPHNVNSDGIFIKTFNWVSNVLNSHVRVYHIPSNVIAESWIEDIMLVKGNTVDYYSPAPEDIFQNATLTSYNCSAAIVGDLIKITSHTPGTTRGWVDVTVNYGNLSNTKRLNWSVEGVEPYKPLGTLLTMNNRGIKY